MARNRIILTVSALLLGGCSSNFGTGGTGEFVVPPQRLREIENIDLTNPPAPTAETEVEPELVEPAPEDLNLSVEEARAAALRNNLDLQVELLEPAIARSTLSEEEAAFEALFTTDARYINSDTPTDTELEGSSFEQLSLTPGIEIPLRTGGVVRLAAPLARTETNNQFSTLNPAYEADASVTLSQPLLRGGWTDANAFGIRIGFYRYQQSEALTKLEVIRVLANADRAYWRLYAARQELEVRKQQYDLAQAQLDRARRQVAAGAVAEVEIVRAESGVADRLEAIIIAENTVRDRQRTLKRIMNIPGIEMGTETIIIPTTEATPQPYELDAERLARVALERRMEMLDLELQLAQQAATIDLAHNNMLPLVTLDYTYNINGLGDAFDDALEMTSDNDFADHVLGLQVSVPIGNEAARSRLRRAMLQRVQLLATQAQRAAQIRQEVLNAVDQLQANWQRILAARQRVDLAQRVLDVEVRQFDIGLRTSTEVLDAQVNLADAKSALIAALAEYQIAQTDIAFATGTLLGAANVDWEPVE